MLQRPPEQIPSCCYLRQAGIVINGGGPGRAEVTDEENFMNLALWIIAGVLAAGFVEFGRY